MQHWSKLVYSPKRKERKKKKNKGRKEKKERKKTVPFSALFLVSKLAMRRLTSLCWLEPYDERRIR